MKRRFVQLLCLSVALLLLAGALAGCGDTAAPGGEEDASPDDAQTPQTGDTDGHDDKLTVAFTSEPPSLTTCDHDSLISCGLNLLTYSSLYKIDNATLEAVPDLAESYVIENDVDWIFTLKQGVKFHDGSDFTAEDVKASLEYAKSFPASVNYTKNIEEVTVIDDYTVKITTPGPYAGLLYDLGFHFNFILPKELIESDHDFNMEPIGTGPYKLVDWVYGNKLTFERFDDYFDEENRGKIKTIEITIIPEGASRAIALEAGEVDFVYEVNGADVANLQNNPDVTVQTIDSVDNVILFLNNDVAPFDDPNFRLALSYAINRQDIVDGALNGYGVPNYSCMTQGIWGSTTENQAEFDLEKAQEYLDAWGGDPSAVSMEILCSNELRVSIATIIQGNLAKLGINVVVTPMDTAAYFAKWDSGDYQALIASWSPATSLMYVSRFHSDRRQSNPGALNSPEIDALVLQAQSTLDDDARKALIEEIVSEVNLLCPQISLYQSQWFRAHNADLADVVCGGTGYMDYWNIRWK